MKVNQITIGDSENTITVTYCVGRTQEGWNDAVPQSSRDDLDCVTHAVSVTMPRLFVGSEVERRVWIRDAILNHFGLEA